MTIIDAQVHAYEANTPRRPWHLAADAPTYHFHDHVTGDELVAAMDRVGVDGAILVSPISMYGYDASYAIEVQRAHPGRFALVKPVDSGDPTGVDTIAEWKKTPGAVGIRILMGIGWPGEPNRSGFDRILREAARQDLPVNFFCWGNLDAAMELIDRHPNTRFVIDHLGIPQPLTPPVPAEPWVDLPKVLELARRPNAVLKVTGACTLSHQPYPYSDIWDPLARLFDAWGFDRCLWGTDWTRAVEVVDYDESVEAFRCTARLSETERAMLVGGACSRVYGWSPYKAEAGRG